MLTLYFYILTKLTYSSNFFVDSLGFSIYTIKSYANSYNFISSFPVFMPFISFSCFHALPRTFGTALTRSSEHVHSCLGVDLRRKALSLSPLSMMLAVGFGGCPLSGQGSVLLFLIC